MTIKIYVSGLSGNYEVKKRQQRIQTVLDSCAIKYELIDITEAGCEEERKFMQETAKAKEGDRNPLPPQIFNDKEYCGDYDGFDFSNETDQLHQFLKLSEGEVNTAQDILSANRRSSSRERSPAQNGLDEPAKADQTDANEESETAAEKKDDDDGPGFWDETGEESAVKEEKKEDASEAQEEKKEEEDGVGFWDQKEDSPAKEAKKEEDDSPATEVKKEEDDSPGFWDKEEEAEKVVSRDDAEEEKADADEETKPSDADVEESEEEEESEEDDDDDESQDVAELKAVAQRLVGSGDHEQENADKEE